MISSLEVVHLRETIPRYKTSLSGAFSEYAVHARWTKRKPLVYFSLKAKPNPKKII
jgi:hypothetical protein